MNPILQLAQSIRNEFPTARLDLDAAQKPNGTWFLDVSLDDYSAVVEWQPHRGFGITSSPAASYGEGADEVYLDLQSAQQRVLALLRARTATVPPPVVTLDMLRKTRRVTQSELAERLEVRQASIAKLEKRADIRLSTLQAFIGAMGGQLSIRALFPDGMERELAFPGSESTDLIDTAMGAERSTTPRE